MLKAYLGSGPFVFCDYWASVLGLKSVMNSHLLGRGLVSLEIFKRGLDRPRAKLPKFKYYLLAFLLGPGMIPYKVVIDLAVLLRSKTRGKVMSKVDAMLERFKLRMEPICGDDKWVRVSTPDNGHEERVLNPTRVSVATSLFYPTYKIIIAAVMVLSLTAVVVYVLPEIHVPVLNLELYSALSYIVLFGLMILLFRDLSTAVLAPLPVFALMYLSKVSGDPLMFVAASLCIAIVFYLVDIFFIPRPMPPALFLYVNDQSSPLYPYVRGHAPYWLKGRCYWVWRFVTLAPAEFHKFWEKDWERVDVWVRADDCDDVGTIEWVVTDIHYRELWFDYLRLATEGQAARQRERLQHSLEQGEKEIVWVTELDMDLLFHTPFVRGIFLSKRRKGRITGPLWRILRAARVRRIARDRFRDYRLQLNELDLERQDFFEDVPEHFRNFALRQLISLPWTYWRYPLGAGTGLKFNIYDPQGALVASQQPAADPHYQLKGWEKNQDRVSKGTEPPE
jgi:hypothetical protein